MKTASLNHVYRLVWSKVQQCLVAVAEFSRAQGKTAVQSRLETHQQSASTINASQTRLALSRQAMLALCVLASWQYAPNAYADSIELAKIVAGDAEFSKSGAHTQITHTANISILDFWKFGIAAGESVGVIMPDAGRALYRVIGNDASLLNGPLSSNGQLFLINQNGVLFGPSAQVSVGSLVVSSLSMTNEDFLAGRYQFKAGDSYGDVVNQGVIKTKDDGYIVMLGKQVENQGTIVADNGSVVLASAREAMLDFYGNGLVKARLTSEAVEAWVKNSGLIQANGGFVQLATSARSAAINVSGIVEANTLVERNGVIRLEGGDNAKVQVSGQLLADGGQGKGGDIIVSGEQVALMHGARLDASGDTGGGNLLVGGGYQGKDADIYNARTTYVSQGASLRADARTQGDGGKVIVWSDHATRYYGTLSAKAGVLGGNGGFAEVSGKHYLNFAGRADLSALNGNTGTLLLDPLNIELTTVDSNTTGFNPGTDLTEAFSDDAGLVSTFNVSAGGSFSGVGNNANISLNAENDILISSDVNLQTATGNTGVSLSLTAKNNINVDADITADGNGFIYMLADSDANGGGDILLKGDLTTQLGSVYLLSASNIDHTAGNVTTTGGNVIVGALGVANLGNLQINTYDPRAGSTLVTGGNVAIGGATGVSMSGAINTVNPASTGVSYLGGQGGNVAVLSLGNVDLGNTTINVAGESVTSVNLPIAGANVAISGNVLIGGANVAMQAGSINTNGTAVSGASTDINITGNVIVAAPGTVNLGTTRIDTTGSTPANSAGVNAGNVLVFGQHLVTGDITANGTAATAANGNGGAGGQILLAGTAGNLTVGNLSAAGGNANGSGNAGAGSAINLTPVAGTVTMQSIDTRGGIATGTGASGNGGAVNVNGNALLAADATINTTGATGGAVNFNGTVDSAASGHYGLTVNSNATTTFKQSIGSGKALASLTTDSAGSTDIYGALVKTTSHQTYNDTVNLHTPVTFETTGGNVTFNGILNAAANAIQVTLGTGDFTAVNSGNQIDHIKVTSAKNVSVQDQDDMTLDDITLSGDLLAKAAQTLTLNGTISTTSNTDTAVQLVADKLDNSGNHAITTGGRWLIYTSSPLNDNRGTTLLNDYDFKQYNTSYGGTILGTGNGFIYQIAPTVTATLTGAASKVYDGNNIASGLTFSTSPTTIDGDTVTVTALTATYDNKHVGSGKTVTTNNMVVTAENGGRQVYGIGLDNTTASANVGTITQRAITVTATTDSKVYDGNVSSSAGPTVTSGTIVVGDSGNFSQEFDSRNAGSRTLTASGSIDDGNGGNNYAVTYATNSGTITQRAITVTATTDSKVYDGNVSSSAGPTVTSGTIVVGDSGNFSQEFDSRNAGSRTLTASGSVDDGNGGNNYAVTYATNSGSISQRAITVTATTDSKVYDATTSSSAGPTVTAGSLSVGDTATFSQRYLDKNAGTGKTLTASGSINDGNAGDNYVVTYVDNTSGVITPAQISRVSGITANDKLFDGNTDATLNTGGATFNGMFSGDQLTVATATGAFVDSAIGVGKTVNVSGISLGGTDAGNYVLVDSTAVTTASILPLINPRDSAGLGGLVGSNPVLNSLTIVSLNPAAGDDDPDYVPCPVVEDKLGSTPVLNSGVKLPNGVVANCI